MKSKTTGLVILLSIFLISTSAFAAQTTFTPRVSAKETYTDNVFLRDKNIAPVEQEVGIDSGFALF